MKRIGLVLASFVVMAIVAACAPTASKATCESTAAIRSFAPDRGEGAIYKNGDDLRFRVNLECPGTVAIETTNGFRLIDKTSLPAGESILPPPGSRLNVAFVAPFGAETVVLKYFSRPGRASAASEETRTWLTTAR